MEAMVAIMIAVLVGTGVYLVLRARTFPVILGITLLSYGVNLFVFISGRLALDQAPIVGRGPATDPLPQALVLTAIVIGFAMTAFLVVLALRGQGETGTDHVDGDADEGGQR
ncbi:Na+/H+ antiporter subunit C [Alloalcanivorax profundimaris]|uniref:Monovalent cation/H+ antiporter subunit C n=1 Tax=Alloalcanivorax profundimaris TaxID=2735259 RepID=A0ABS0AVC1_9GAMM|nr:Na+/H+ antiporter subunit C [Alloalcanivorax profundimaris]MAO58620.1 Na+/H+ antiporter subunit C [Alcanivorax sp.]MBM1142554.1 Na+/H+ antiporter subunit C [Alcanivorax sp. ZXX171]MCQ6260515.1 Na+/H+ antiporter subunit C [Alcanivorax sp. MM125-6]UWN50310.1 Na(+)/H(+) antiporter subunit C1 [Alcanivorax sp. ALC70]MAY09472.1 Na+/H+ antiporter subunit C [Alcanivorax sp.]|tara:strand:+ start:383 stop:718 length:336 start_codon:yes stop_codon:yes gene_type:complete